MFYGFTVRFLCAVLISGALGASIAVAANQYIELSPPVEKLEGTQIEVVEVFSYGASTATTWKTPSTPGLKPCLQM